MNWIIINCVQTFAQNIAKEYFTKGKEQHAR